VLFLVYSCIPAQQWTDICNTRCSIGPILSRFSHFHVSHFPPLQHDAAFSCPAISTLARWCRKFMSRIFSVPANRSCMRRRQAAATNQYPLLASELSSKPTAHRCCCRSTGQTDRTDRQNRRTADRCIMHGAPHPMRAASINES